MVRIKNLNVLVFLFFLPIYTLSQPSYWAQPGANWIYNFGDGTSFSSTGTVELKRAGDTLINGINCDVLTVHYQYIENWPGGTFRDFYDANLYTYMNNDTVFIYVGNAFHIYFILYTQPGSGWVTPPDTIFGCQSDTIFIDSIQTVNVNGVMMKKLIPELFDWGDPNHPTQYFHHPIYERFGSTGYFLPRPSCFVCPSWGPLICYTDSSGFIFSNTGICPVSLQEFSNDPPWIQVTPNIASDEIRLTTLQKHENRELILGVYDATGRRIRTINLQEQTDYFFNISNLSPGFYFIRPEIKTKMRAVYFLKK